MRSALVKKYQTRATRYRQRRRLRIFLLIVIVIFFIVGSGLYYFMSERFQIRDVVFDGLSRTPEDDARQVVSFWLADTLWYVFPQNILWLARTDELASRLTAALPTVRKVSIMKKYPNQLTLAFQEYNEWGVLCHGEPEECVWIDRSGVAFEKTEGFSGIIVPKIHDMREREFRLGEEQLSQDMMRLIMYFNERAVADEHLQSLQFIIDKKDETLRVTTRGGWDILLLEHSDPESVYKNLHTALEGEIKDKISHLEYVDLRFGNRIFYKFKE